MKAKSHFQNQTQGTGAATGATPSEGAGRNHHPAGPSHEDVAIRAYHKFLSQGSRPGHELEDWLAAEAEILAERSSARPGPEQNHSPSNRKTYLL